MDPFADVRNLRSFDEPYTFGRGIRTYLTELEAAHMRLWRSALRDATNLWLPECDADNDCASAFDGLRGPARLAVNHHPAN